MQETTLKALDAMVKMAQEVNEWDEFPMLLVVQKSGPDSLVVLDGDDVFEMLATVGPRLREGGLHDVTGLVFANEGWALSSERVHDLKTVAAELRASGKSFSDHPDAVEVKIFTALDAEGLVMRQIERGNPEVQEMPAGGTTSGRMPDHLRALLMELTA